jgi:acyl-CoA thioesterase
MDPKIKAQKVVEKMFAGDAFSQWLEISIGAIDVGKSTLSMTIREDMLNGFKVAHGSITYALADSALAFASNSHGKKCLSIDTQISHLRPCQAGDELKAEAKELSRSRNLGRYDVEIKNQNEELVAHFRGTVFIKDEFWEVT